MNIYISVTWLYLMQTNRLRNGINARISIVNFRKDKLIVNGQCINKSQLSNKYFYNEYINVQFLKPIGINIWLMSINEKNKHESALLFHFSLFRRFSHIYCQIFRIRTHGWRKWHTTVLTSTIGSEKFQFFFINNNNIPTIII